MAVKRAESVVVKGRTVTAEAVRKAMDLCDRMGMEAFLKAHGYGEAARYWLRGATHNRRYPTKAILGVAAGLRSEDFFGGAAHTVASLQRLGFEVREGEEPVGAVGLDALREEAVAQGFDDPAPDWDNLPVTPTAVFASGSNRPGEIRGLARVGMDVGVAATYVTDATEEELVKLAGTDVQVFVDSGAFSEVEFSPEVMGFVKVEPITDAQWEERLALYQRLGAALGSQAWLVAPDRVGSQEETIERLTRWAPKLQEIARTGARLMVVAQKGAKSQADFFRAAVEAAGLAGLATVVAGLPCKKAATTAEEVGAFVRDAGVSHVHLLGKGPNGNDVHDYLAPFAAEGVETSVSLDACWITANAGKTNGRGKGERRYTKAQRFAAGVLAGAGRIASAVSKVAQDVALKLELAFMLCLGAPIPTLRGVAAPAGVPEGSPQLQLFAVA